MRIKHFISTIILFFSSLGIAFFFEWNQHLLPYIFPIILIGILYILDLFVIKPNYIACIYTISFILIGIFVELIDSGNLKLHYLSFLHILTIPLSFLIYYSYHERKKLFLGISLVLLISVMLTNYFFRKEIFEYDAYGAYSEISKKNIEVKKVAVLDKGGRDTIIQFNDQAYILDIWGLYCPICYSDMGYIDSIKKSDTGIRFISLLAMRRQDSIKSIKKLNELVNSYPSYIVKDTSLLKKLEINKFPNYLILYKKKIVYRNSLENVLKQA